MVRGLLSLGTDPPPPSFPTQCPPPFRRQTRALRTQTLPVSCLLFCAFTRTQHVQHGFLIFPLGRPCISFFSQEGFSFSLPFPHPIGSGTFLWANGGRPLPPPSFLGGVPRRFFNEGLSGVPLFFHSPRQAIHGMRTRFSIFLFHGPPALFLSSGDVPRPSGAYKFRACFCTLSEVAGNFPSRDSPPPPLFPPLQAPRDFSSGSNREGPGYPPVSRHPSSLLLPKEHSTVVTPFLALPSTFFPIINDPTASA